MKVTWHTCVTYKGLTFPIRGWAVRMQIDQRIIKRRLTKGWSVKRSLTMPPDEKELVATPPKEKRVRSHVPRLIEYGGESLSVKSWAQKLGMCEMTIRGRLKLGLPPAQVLGFEKPVFPRRCHVKTYTYNGKTQSVSEWSRELGIDPSWLLKKLKSDRPDEKKFAKKYKPKHKPRRKNTALARKRRKLARERSFAAGMGTVVTDAVPAAAPPASDPASR